MGAGTGGRGPASRRAVFVDKDGTIVRDVPFNVDPERIELLPHATAGLRRFMAAGFTPVMITNQSGIALGHFTEPELLRYLMYLSEVLEGEGVHMAGIEYCPHAAPGPGAAGCECRKPRPGMLERAASRLRIEPVASWMVGDTLDDVAAGHRAGCRSAFVGRASEAPGPGERAPDVVGPDLLSIATAVIAVPAPSLPMTGDVR